MRFVCVCGRTSKAPGGAACSHFSHRHTRTHSYAQRGRGQGRKFPGWENQGSVTIRSCDKQQRYRLLRVCALARLTSRPNKWWWARKHVHVSWITLYVFVVPYTRISSSAVFPAQTHINPSERHTFHSLALTAMQWPSLCDVVISFQRHCREPGGEIVSHTLCLSPCTWHCDFFYHTGSFQHQKTHNRLQYLSNICEYLQFACTWA